MNAIWFVVHHRNLWDIDNRLIGFWKKHQMDLVSEGDYIIYYRAGADYKKIMGVFRAGQKRTPWNADFHDEEIYGKLSYQCRIDLVSDDVICKKPTTERAFSFFDEWVENDYGYKKQVYLANYSDIKLILRDPTVVK